MDSKNKTNRIQCSEMKWINKTFNPDKNKNAMMLNKIEYSNKFHISVEWPKTTK